MLAVPFYTKKAWWLPLLGIAWLVACQAPMQPATGEAVASPDAVWYQAPDSLQVLGILLNGADTVPLATTRADSLRYCADKAAWQQAALQQQPAWCYQDTVHRRGILYNYYAVIQPLVLPPGWQLLGATEAATLVAALGPPKSGLQAFFPEGLCMERNYLGNYYNLQFANYWVANGTALVLDTQKGTAHLSKPHPGNGYRLLLSAAPKVP
jgi:hypothetical protein